MIRTLVAKQGLSNFTATNRWHEFKAAVLAIEHRVAPVPSCLGRPAGRPSLSIRLHPNFVSRPNSDVRDVASAAVLGAALAVGIRPI